MSLRLILMRHAKSSWDDASLDDHDRPLNGRGRRSAVALGKWLQDKGYLPDTVLCSDAVRTRETFERLGLGVLPVKYLKEIYHASTGVILDTLRDKGAGKCVLIVTHNPGCADFADRIVTEPVKHDRFFDYPTGATLVVDLSADNWEDVAFHTGTAVDFVIPRELTD
ncbi:SixA phosphatase family protein [Marimonas arenosa]|uniref:Histidine phosphatase family protein n=1 Tax=Marimonas arenosa TaxID=1795305 RepID=A0AAE4B5U1_9RHOB|nr:histidine phosphatase family protein [Marimonas arenosa]MDQ2092358.1 histidine phosphatase family protein [Marimonas arenosa]